MPCIKCRECSIRHCSCEDCRITHILTCGILEQDPDLSRNYIWVSGFSLVLIFGFNIAVKHFWVYISRNNNSRERGFRNQVSLMSYLPVEKGEKGEHRVKNLSISKHRKRHKLKQQKRLFLFTTLMMSVVFLPIFIERSTF